MKNKSLTIVSVIAAGLASLCCIGPLAALGLGVGAFGAATFFESLRPFLLAAAAGLLGAAFYLTYRKKPEEKCEEGICAVPKRSQKLTLWIATLVAIPLATFPFYASAFRAEAGPEAGTHGSALTAKAANADGTAVLFDVPPTATEVVFAVEGMTCAGCAAGIQATLARAAGVQRIEVRYDDKTARIVYDASAITEQQLVSAFRELGYTVARRKTT